MPKTSTERSRACRERKRGLAPPPVKKPPKSSAQRVREYRARQKALKSIVFGNDASLQGLQEITETDIIMKSDAQWSGEYGDMQHVNENKRRKLAKSTAQRVREHRARKKALNLNLLLSAQSDANTTGSYAQSSAVINSSTGTAQAQVEVHESNTDSTSPCIEIDKFPVKAIFGCPAKVSLALAGLPNEEIDNLSTRRHVVVLVQHFQKNQMNQLERGESKDQENDLSIKDEVFVESSEMHTDCNSRDILSELEKEDELSIKDEIFVESGETHTDSNSRGILTELDENNVLNQDIQSQVNSAANQLGFIERETTKVIIKQEPDASVVFLDEEFGLRTPDSSLSATNQFSFLEERKCSLGETTKVFIKESNIKDEFLDESGFEIPDSSFCFAVKEEHGRESPHSSCNVRYIF